MRRISNPSHDFTEVVITIPTHLADWVEKVSQALALTPDQFITKILESYKSVWDAAREYLGVSEAEIPKRELTELEMIERYRIHLKGKGYNKTTIKNNLNIIKRFLQWCAENSIQIDTATRDHIHKFLTSLNVKPSTRLLYKCMLQNFLEFMKTLQAG